MLDRLEPEHLEAFYRKMQQAGSKSATAHHAHRTIRVALGGAVRRGHVATNATEIAKAPRLEEEDIEPYDIEEVRRRASWRRTGCGTAPAGSSPWPSGCDRAKRSGSTGRTSTWTRATPGQGGTGFARRTSTAAAGPVKGSPAADRSVGRSGVSSRTRSRAPDGGRSDCLIRGQAAPCAQGGAGTGTAGGRRRLGGHPVRICLAHGRSP